jgi:hypothetical protein
MVPPTHRSRWELGSESHWMGLPEPPFVKWPRPANWYLLARHSCFPFCFSTQQERDECLQESDIYCPVHWVVQTVDQDAISLSERMLSLPVDQRYSEADMNRIVEVLASNRAQQAAEVEHR